MDIADTIMARLTALEACLLVFLRRQNLADPAFLRDFAEDAQILIDHLPARSPEGLRIAELAKARVDHLIGTIPPPPSQAER